MAYDLAENSTPVQVPALSERYTTVNQYYFGNRFPQTKTFSGALRFFKALKFCGK